MLKIVEQAQTLTRQHLRAAVYDGCPQLSRAEARQIFDATFDELAAALMRGEPVKTFANGEKEY
jgi:integration host factor subunit alpha